MKKTIKFRRMMSTVAALRVFETLGAVQRPLTVSGKPLDPRLPNDITALNDHDLMRLFNNFVRMMQWINQQIALAESRLAEFKRQDKILRTRLWLLSSGNDKVRSALVETHPDVLQLGTKLLEADSAVRLLTALANGFLESRNVASRELTRRVGLEDSRGRGGQFGS